MKFHFTKMQSFRLALAASCSALLSAGCGQAKSASELPGSFLADYRFACERLVLCSDGTFTQKVVLKSDNTTRVAAGTWQFDSIGQCIKFDTNFLLVVDGLGQFRSNYTAPLKGTVLLPVTKFLGRTSLEMTETVRYRKQ
jgi:hypothetical protein